MIRLGVVGYGYWGPNVVRNFAETPGCQLIAVSDMRPERLAQVRSRYPAIRTFADPNEMIADRRIDAVVIVTPVSTHYDLAMQALRAGKHVLVEKPITATAEQAARLVDEAARRRVVLSVDHTFVYSGAVRKIREIVTRELGDIYYYDSVRVNLGLFQHDVNVIWDLAVHDLAIMDHVLPGSPVAVSATGMSHLEGEPENIAFITMFYPNRLIAHLHVNWLAPVKVRRTLISGSRKMIVYDDLEPSEKVKVYDKGVTVNVGDGGANGSQRYRMLIDYRTGDMCAPQLDITEALKTEAKHFISCVETGQPTMTDGEAGLRVVRILEAATESIAQRGRIVELDALGCAV